MNAKKHIVFDWNGTLLDDIMPCMPAPTNCWKAKATRRSHRIFSGRITIFRSGSFIDNFGSQRGQIDVDELKTARFTIITNQWRRAGLREGAKEFFAHANTHGMEMLILSNHLVDPIRSNCAVSRSSIFSRRFWPMPTAPRNSRT